MLRNINDYYLNEREKPDYLIRLLIPNNYVTKLIGKCKFVVLFFKEKKIAGCMIRDIAKRSGGA